MRWFSREPEDLVTPEDLARSGRFQMLGPELSEVAVSEAMSLTEPLRSHLYDDPAFAERVANELRRHAARGEWEAVGAWQFVVDFVPDETLDAEMTDTALLALERMRITNLAIHLGRKYLTRFQELTGHPAPDDGFFGPPVFDSSFGPRRQYYFDQALAAAAARAPQRIPNGTGVEPGQLNDAVRGMWDFGMLILRGPLLVASDVRFEPNLVQAAVRAASNVDHSVFCDRLNSDLVEKAGEEFNGWTFMGAARFVEDYLDPSLTGGVVHARLVDAGLKQLNAKGMFENMISIDVLSLFERERL